MTASLSPLVVRAAGQRWGLPAEQVEDLRWLTESDTAAGVARLDGASLERRPPRARRRRGALGRGEPRAAAARRRSRRAPGGDRRDRRDRLGRRQAARPGGRPG